MTFEVGDRVKDNIGRKGVVQELLTTGCFVNYGTSAEFEFYKDLKHIRISKKYITLEQADRMALKEQREQIDTDKLVNEFCDKLGSIR